MAAVPNIQKSYNAGTDELVHIMTAVDLAAPTGTHRGEFDLTAKLYFSGTHAEGPPKRAVLAVMWIGLERKFSTPAILAVEIDGAEVFKTLASHYEEIDGGTIDESVSAEVDLALLKRVAEAGSVTVRVDELRGRSLFLRSTRAFNIDTKEIAVGVAKVVCEEKHMGSRVDDSDPLPGHAEAPARHVLVAADHDRCSCARRRADCGVVRRARRDGRKVRRRISPLLLARGLAGQRPSRAVPRPGDGRGGARRQGSRVAHGVDRGDDARLGNRDDHAVSRRRARPRSQRARGNGMVGGDDGARRRGHGREAVRLHRPRPRGVVQPAVKCRGPEYLRIIYGPEYSAPQNITRLRARRVGAKRSLAMREFSLGVEALQRFVARQPLRRVHECVFGVLALESEPVDPRL